MNKRWISFEGRTWSCLALPWAAAFTLHCPAAVSGADLPGASAVPSAMVITAPLEYEARARPFLFRNIPVECRTNSFSKEPARLSGHVIRGIFKFGPNPANALPFVWHTGARKLFLDLHRNQDLTDDPDGVISGELTGPQFGTIYHQMFTNICLSFPASSAGAPMVMDLDFFQNGDSGHLLVGALVHSFWQGKITVAGNDWQVGLVQNLSDRPGSFQAGQLLLRPWAEQDKWFTAASEAPEDTEAESWTVKNLVVRASHAVAFTPKVFLEGRAWQLDWSAEPRSREEKFALRLTELPTTLGELRLTGSFIHRLVLTGGPYLVILNQPAASVKIPPGRYQPYRLWLKQGEAEAYFEYGLPQTGKANVSQPETWAQMPVATPPPPEQAVTVDEQRAAVLAVGGPLTNCVSATRQGRNLLLRYQLLGAGGGQYWLAGGGDRLPPRFDVTKSGKKVGAGQFEFG